MAFKICSVGCGAMAKTGHGPSFQKYANDHADVVLGACCDINEESAQWFQHRFGSNAFEEYVLSSYGTQTGFDRSVSHNFCSCDTFCIPR